jgi:hypothetical protein
MEEEKNGCYIIFVEKLRGQKSNVVDPDAGGLIPKGDRMRWRGLD